MIAVIIAVTAAARYGDVFDYAAPNLASNQLVVYAGGGQQVSMAKTADAIGSALGARHVIGLETTTAFLVHPSPPYEAFGGSAFHVATPQLLRAFGISASRGRPEGRRLDQPARLLGHLRRLSDLVQDHRTAGRTAPSETAIPSTRCAHTPAS